MSEASENGARVNGEWIAAELVIGADGANGSSARLLGLSHTPTYGVAFEGNLVCPPAKLDRWPNTVVIEFGTVPGGYCWIFPKGDHLNVGVGGWEHAGPMLRGYLKEFCIRRGFDYSSLQDLRGYRLPGRQPGARLSCGRSALIGDAAGLVDPLAGDGMYASFLSSRLATEAAMKVLAGQAADLEPYALSLVSEFGRMFAFAWNAKIALDRFPRLALAAVLSPPGWRTLEHMLRGEIREPEREHGISGVAVRGFELVVNRLGWPGAKHRAEATSQPLNIQRISANRR